MKKYIKPETTVVKIELASMIAASPSEYSNTIDVTHQNGSDESKETDFSFSVWDDEVEE